MSEQIITVAFKDADKSEAKLSFYDYRVRRWNPIVEDVPAVGGKYGFSRDKREGDMKTPIGTYSVEYVFGTVGLDNLRIKYVPISTHVWVDDPESKCYNRLQPADSKWQWKSSEKLNIPAYKYAIVIGYNRDIVEPYKGSAIFLHCRTENPYTAGCIAIEEEDIKKVASELNKFDSPIIVINTEDYINDLRSRMRTSLYI